MRWPSLKEASTRYWLKVYLLYVVFEACIQLFFFLTVNIFDAKQLSDIEYHFLMWIFQCAFVLPIWYIAHLFRQRAVWQQVIANTTFFIAYTFFWYGPVIHLLMALHDQLRQITHPNNKISFKADRWAIFYTRY